MSSNNSKGYKPTEAEIKLQGKLDAHLTERAKLAGVPMYAINRGILSWWSDGERGAMRVLVVEHNGAQRSFQLHATHADRGFLKAPNRVKRTIRRRKRTTTGEQRHEPGALPKQTKPEPQGGLFINAQSFAELMCLADLILERSDAEVEALMIYVQERRQRTGR